MYPGWSHLFVSWIAHANQPWWCHGSLHQYWKVISSSSCSLLCTLYHMLGSISNLPQDWLGCSCYLSENRLPNSVIKFLCKLAHYLFDYLSWNLPQVAGIMCHLPLAVILWQLDTYCWAMKRQNASLQTPILPFRSKIEIINLFFSQISFGIWQPTLTFWHMHASRSSSIMF